MSAHSRMAASFDLPTLNILWVFLDPVFRGFQSLTSIETHVSMKKIKVKKMIVLSAAFKLSIYTRGAEKGTFAQAYVLQCVCVCRCTSWRNECVIIQAYSLYLHGCFWMWKNRNLTKAVMNNCVSSRSSALRTHKAHSPELRLWSLFSLSCRNSNRCLT